MIQKMTAHMKLQIRCALSPSKSKTTPILFLSIPLPHWPESEWCHKRGASTLVALHAFKHGLALQPRHFTQKAATSHPCVSWQSKICATCFGFASSNAVFNNIVGLPTLPCLKTGFPSSCHSKCFCNRFVIITCKCWQLVPATPPKCRFFQFSGSYDLSRRRIIQDAYHFDITDDNAIAL